MLLKSRDPIFDPSNIMHNVECRNNGNNVRFVLGHWPPWECRKHTWEQKLVTEGIQLKTFIEMHQVVLSITMTETNEYNKTLMLKMQQILDSRSVILCSKTGRQPWWHQGASLRGSRGYKDVLRMLLRLQKSITTRSNPTPNPPWGHAPYLKSPQKQY